MKFTIISSLVFGAFFFLIICVLDVKAELNVQSYPRRLGKSYPLTTRAEHDDSNPPPVDPVESAAPGSRKGDPWTAEEEERLVELRDQRKSWAELSILLPGRTWTALKTRYNRLTKDRRTTRMNLRLWTDEEEELLIELMEMDVSDEELVQYFPGRSLGSIKAKSSYIFNDASIPNRIRREYTAEEDELILELGKENIPWEERVKYFDNRTLSALRHRYKKLTSQVFTPEEDKLLLELEKEGVPWQERVTYFNDRNLDSLQKRFKIGSSRSGRRKWYTSEEEDLIVEAVESGMTLEEICELVERSAGSIKDRVKILKKAKRLDESAKIAKGRVK